MQDTARLEEIIKQAYAIIGKMTPLKADCGRLCGAACCKDLSAGGTEGTDAEAEADAEVADGVASETAGSVAPDVTPGATDIVVPNMPDGVASETVVNVALNVPDATGMVLFPGEVGLVSGGAGFRLFRILYMGAPAWFLVCEGVCDRRKRPLACRIFPLAPHIKEVEASTIASNNAAANASSITARPDPRALRVCPLADSEHLDPAFRRAVTKAFRHLAQAGDIYEYMRMLSADLDDMRRFIKNFPRR
ncbi:MAG: hypothetical protein FWH01_05235 [Oscillospiraceae bacterium]|nr:hypothetical protein [Oscillospiraceae bacterium]